MKQPSHFDNGVDQSNRWAPALALGQFLNFGGTKENGTVCLGGGLWFWGSGRTMVRGRSEWCYLYAYLGTPPDKERLITYLANCKL